MPKEMPTAAETQVGNCPTITENSTCTTLPQPQANYKAQKLNSSLANGFWIRNPRCFSLHDASCTAEELSAGAGDNSHADSNGAETPSHIAYVMQKTSASVYYLKCSSQRLCLTLLSPQLFCNNTTSHLCFLKAFPAASIPFAPLLSQILPYHGHHIKNTLISYHLGILY